MTANEAIKILEVAKAECEWNAPLDYQEAFDLAISALREQDLQPTCNNLATDAISRQAAIDALGGNEPVGDPSKMDDDDVIKMWERIRIINIINKLPSAQPEIIVCADCKHWICHDRRCGYWNHGVKPLEWCCHAEGQEE